MALQADECFGLAMHGEVLRRPCAVCDGLRQKMQLPFAVGGRLLADRCGRQLERPGQRKLAAFFLPALPLRRTQCRVRHGGGQALKRRHPWRKLVIAVQNAQEHQQLVEHLEVQDMRPWCLRREGVPGLLRRLQRGAVLLLEAQELPEHEVR
jgi:hypothetical protein